MNEIEKEYLSLKEQYKKLKEIQNLGKEDEEGKKYRKKIKKKIKQLKSQRITALNEVASQKSKASD